MKINNITTENVKYLSKIFSSSLIKSSIKQDNFSQIKSIISESGFDYLLTNNKMVDVYTEVFNLLAKYHRNEYIYKSAIIEQILLGNHDLESIILSEFNVDNCKADIAIYNGTSTVYEIKTELDTFDRLERQLSAYSKAFDRIYVITPETHVKKLIDLVDDFIGILVLDSNNIIKEFRKAKSNIHNLDSSILYDLLRRNEVLRIIEMEYGTIIDVPNTKIYSVSKEIFSKIPTEKAHEYVVKVLKKRGAKTKDFLLKVPSSFHSFAINSNFSKKEQSNFLNFLNSSIIK